MRHFAQYGIVTLLKMVRNKKTQEPLGFAFVEYEKEAIAKKVLTIKHYIDGREVRFCSSRSMLSLLVLTRKLTSSKRTPSKKKCTSRDYQKTLQKRHYFLSSKPSGRSTEHSFFTTIKAAPAEALALSNL